MKKYKRVVVLSSFISPNNSSPVGVNKKLLTLCMGCFEEVVFLTSNFPKKELEELDVELVNVPINWHFSSQMINLIKFVWMQFKLLPLLKQYADKDTLALFWLSGPMGIPLWYAKRLGLRTMSFLYGNSILKSEKVSLYNRLIAAVMKFMAHHADYVGVESKAVLRQWDITLSPEKVKVVFLYCDTEKFRERIPYAQRGSVIGMSCRLAANKRVEESIEAFHALRQEFPDWKLEIIGSGVLNRRCGELIAKLGEEDRISLEGWIENDAMPVWYNRWKLLLFPTNYEGLPNSLIESMCCGTPALASPVGGIPDVVQDKVSGWILHGGSVEDIENALREVLAQQSMGNVATMAQGFCSTTYSPESAHLNFWGVMAKVMGGNGR